MTNKYQQLLNDYYRQKGIHPLDFRCRKQDKCRHSAANGEMTETKMSMVGSQYGEKYPKIVVVSLDPPSGKKKGNKPPRWNFKAPEERTTEYVSSTHEKDDYSIDHGNQHWAMTQIIVKDILVLWNYPAKLGVANVQDKYQNLRIENVSAYFAHVNVAKCSMNKQGQRQADFDIHDICSKEYLLEELVILEPDVLITQGENSNLILGKMLVGKAMFTSDLPQTKTITLANRPVFWMPMRHPTQQLHNIREAWPVYLRAAKAWAKEHPGYPAG